MGKTGSGVSKSKKGDLGLQDMNSISYEPPKEEWKEIPEFDGELLVSNKSRIIKLTRKGRGKKEWKFLKAVPGKDNYYRPVINGVLYNIHSLFWKKVLFDDYKIILMGGIYPTDYAINREGDVISSHTGHSPYMNGDGVRLHINGERCYYQVDELVKLTFESCSILHNEEWVENIQNEINSSYTEYHLAMAKDDIQLTIVTWAIIIVFLVLFLVMSMSMHNVDCSVVFGAIILACLGYGTNDVWKKIRKFRELKNKNKK